MQEQTCKYLKYAQQRSTEMMAEASRQRLVNTARPSLKTSLALWLNGLAEWLEPNLSEVRMPANHLPRSSA